MAWTLKTVLKYLYANYVLLFTRNPGPSGHTWEKNTMRRILSTAINAVWLLVMPRDWQCICEEAMHWLDILDLIMFELMIWINNQTNNLHSHCWGSCYMRLHMRDHHSISYIRCEIIWSLRVSFDPPLCPPSTPDIRYLGTYFLIYNYPLSNWTSVRFNGA
jgi:hypothetical protein